MYPEPEKRRSPPSIISQSHFTECLVLHATEYHVSGPTYRIIHAKIQNGFAFLDEIYHIMAPIPIAPHMT
jgi:hypothetical protein